MINLKIFENWYDEKISKEEIEELIKNFNNDSIKLYNNNDMEKNHGLLSFVYLKDALKNRQIGSGSYFIFLSDSEIEYLKNLDLVNREGVMLTCEDEDIPEIIRIMTKEKREMLKNKQLFNL